MPSDRSAPPTSADRSDAGADLAMFALDAVGGGVGIGAVAIGEVAIGAVGIGAVGVKAATLTKKWLVAVCVAVSVATQVTMVVPIGNTEPEIGLHTTTAVPPCSSVASGFT
jgi:hypothetical protein